MNAQDIEKLVPHRYPFLMLDRVTELKESEYIKGYKNISIGEECFKGHFPGMPIFPGAFTAEVMAQAVCVLFKKSMTDLDASKFFVTNIKLRFLKPVVPGDRLCVTAKAVKMARIGGVFETEASVDGETVAQGEMTFACK